MLVQKFSLIFMFFSAVFLPKTVNSAKILFFSAMASKSMKISQLPLAEALADKGHSVTFLTAWPETDGNQNSKVYSHVPKKLHKLWQEDMQNEHLDFYANRKNQQSPLSLWLELNEFGLICCETLYSDSDFVPWVKANKFDLVILDTAGNECAYGLIDFWKAKHATYATSTMMPFYYDAFGLAEHSSAVPDPMLRIADGSKMTFSQRFYSAALPIVTHVIRDYKLFPALEAMTEKELGVELTKSFSEMEKNTNLVLATTHYSFDQAYSLPPNVIPIGGNVVAKNEKPLPKEIKDFIESKDDGLIFISFGTVAEFTRFDESVQIEFINALRQFPNVKFLWKSKPINVTTLPSNVMVVNWVAQQTILAHPNVRAFISHSGMGSTVEAIHYSVPVICIPILADQDYLAAMTAQRGAGIILEIIGLKEAELANAIDEILHNQKYKEGMKKLTAIFKDRPSPPLETAVWWIEYVLRHDNTNEYLLSPSANQPWWKRRQLDVWIVASVLSLTLVSLPLIVIYYLIKKLLCKRVPTGISSKLKPN